MANELNTTPHERAHTLQQRVGPRDPRAEAELVAQAEAALVVLSSQFTGWLDEEVERLSRARGAVGSSSRGDDGLNRLFTAALDLKGLGATYGFPLVTRLAASLCKLLGEGDMRLLGPQALLDAHVDAIRIAVRDGLRDDGAEVTKLLAARLEELTAAASGRAA